MGLRSIEIKNAPGPPAFLVCSMDQWIGESPDYSLSFRFFGCTFQLINYRRPGRIPPLTYASMQERDNIFVTAFVPCSRLVGDRCLNKMLRGGCFFQCSICSCATNLLLFLLWKTVFFFSMICLCVYFVQRGCGKQGALGCTKTTPSFCPTKQTVVFFHISLSFLIE